MSSLSASSDLTFGSMLQAAGRIESQIQGGNMESRGGEEEEEEVLKIKGREKN